MLGCVVATNGAIDKGARECTRIRDIEKVRNIERRGRLAVDDADDPALLREAPMPSTDVSLCIGVHVGKASVPEEPDVLLVDDLPGVEEVVVNIIVWARVKEVVMDRVNSFWRWVDWIGHLGLLDVGFL